MATLTKTTTMVPTSSKTPAASQTSTGGQPFDLGCWLVSMGGQEPGYSACITTFSPVAAITGNTGSQTSQAPSINWQDLGIRTGLVLAGAILFIVGVVKVFSESGRRR